MSNIKQTAIQLLKERLLKIQSNYKEGTAGHNCFGIASNLCDEYSQDFKQQIKSAYSQGCLDTYKKEPKNGQCEKYYNETFKKD